jgi:prepilin-type N-terminal cleavage/methylation domain-containing protein
MRQRVCRTRHGCPESGFSLIELLVVVGIIAVMAAVSLPAIGRYFRNYQIRNAAREVASEIQTARTKAIMKNVNWGVLFVTLSPTTYQVVIEDDPASPATRTLNILGPVRTLPGDVMFTNAGPSSGISGNELNPSVRYDRLGAACDPGSNTVLCPDVAYGAGYMWYVKGADSASGGVVANTGWFIDLAQPSTGLTQTVRVLSGGRVQVPR